MATAQIFDKDKKVILEYYIEPKMKRSLDTKVIPSIQVKDKDYVIVIDGGEGKGKSTLAFQIGRYVDNSLDITRVTFTPEEFREAIMKAEKGQCVIYDEAFTGFSSRNSLSGVNRILVSLAMQMRQKNLFVIVVLPTFFLLDKYIALFRAKVLIHVFESRGIRGYYKVYNSWKKKFLYLEGHKTYSYNQKKIRTNFLGRFYGKFALGDEKVEELYRKKKMKALMDTDKNPMTAGQVKYREQRDLCIYLLRKHTKLTYYQLADIMNDLDFTISFVQVRNICAKFGDKETEADKIVKKGKELVKKSGVEVSEECSEGIEDDIPFEND